MGIVYATDNGADVVEGANGSLYHSAFAEAASQYAYDHGVAQVYSGDDLNTGNHNYPANYDHTMLIQGVATDSQGLGQDFGPEAQDFLEGLGVPLGSSVPVLTYFRGANTTQFGGHSSIAMEGATGSENTGKAAGAAALVISAARDKGVTLRPDETRAILEQTAEDVLPGNTAGAGNADATQEGWDEHFGWGRADLGAAVGVAVAGEDAVPPEASIGSPDWYAPVGGSAVSIGGLARARFADELQWRLEWGPGLAPTSWTEVSSGTSAGQVTDFGSLDLGAVRAALASHTPPEDPGAPIFKPGSPHPYTGQFTVRLTVTADGAAVPGVDRKVLTAIDPAEQRLRDGFPKRLGTGGEAALRYADLDGDAREELLVPLEDGTLHAYRPDGSEPPGWPVTTGLMAQASAHAESPGLSALPPAREPLRGPVVADLTGDGSPEVVATAGRHVYAWGADGAVLDGFPVSVDLANCRGADQRQEDRHRKCGFLAGPALARVEGRGSGLRIVAPALDGHLYALRPDGSPVPGYPVELVDPDVPAEDRMLAESINQPAVEDLSGDGYDDVVVATNEVYANSGSLPPGSGDLPSQFAEALETAAGTSSRLYAIDGRTGEHLEGWPVHLDGLIQNVLPLIGPGHDAAIFHDGDEPVIVASTTGGQLRTFGVDGSPRAVMAQGAALNLFESAVVGDVSGAGRPAVVKYQVDAGQAANLALVGQNVPYSHRIGAFDAQSGSALPGWPTITDDYQFLSSSTVASVTPDGRHVLAGTGLGLLHAYDGVTASDAPGFPKITGGWLYSPAAVASDGRLAAITREGFLFEWDSDAPECQTEWPSFRHDAQASGNYDRDGTAPGAPTGVRAEHLGGVRYRVTFTRPREDGRCGAPTTRHEVSVDGERVGLAGETTDGDSVSADVVVPPGATRAGGRAAARLSVVAVDEAGNRGAPAHAQLEPQRGGPGPRADGPQAAAASGAGEASCTAGSGFARVRVLPRGSGLRIEFARRIRRPVDVDVFQEAIGRRVVHERRLAHFTSRTRSLTWSGRGARQGHLFVRLRMALPGGGTDVRRVAVRRSGARFSVLPRFYRPDRCGLVTSFKLSRPVFGGTGATPLGIAFRLERMQRVAVTVRHGGRVVRRFTATTLRGGVTHRLQLGARGRPRGMYAVQLRVGDAVVTLRARRI
jgi:hypothetical protein